MRFYVTIFSVFVMVFTAAVSAGAGAEPNTAATAITDSVAVSVNGTDIMESRVDTMLNSIIKTEANKIPPELLQQFKKQLRAQVLEELIAEHLVDQKIKEKNMTVNQADIDNEISKMLNKEGLSKEEFGALLKAYGTSLEEYKKQVKFRKRILYQKFFEAEFAGKVNISAEQAGKYYSENTEQYKVPEQVRVSHILIDITAIDPNSDAVKAKSEARSKAEQLLAQIRAGADFEELARMKIPGQQGGDLGFLPRNAGLPENFMETAFALKTGQVSNVIETKYGFHIIKAADRKEESTKDFKQVKDQIIHELTLQKKQALATEYIESLKAAATIVYPPGKENQN